MGIGTFQDLSLSSCEGDYMALIPEAAWHNVLTDNKFTTRGIHLINAVRKNLLVMLGKLLGLFLLILLAWLVPKKKKLHLILYKHPLPLVMGQSHTNKKYYSVQPHPPDMSPLLL